MKHAPGSGLSCSLLSAIALVLPPLSGIALFAVQNTAFYARASCVLHLLKAHQKRAAPENIADKP
jgi:hypothetical protein